MRYSQHAFMLDEMDVIIKFVNERSIQATQDFTKLSLPHTLVWIVHEGSRDILAQGKHWTLQKNDVVLFPPHYPAVKLLRDTESGMFRYTSFGIEWKIGTIHFTDMYGFSVVNRPHCKEQNVYEFVQASRDLAMNYYDFFARIGSAGYDHQLRLGKLPIQLNVEQTSNYLRMKELTSRWIHRLFNLLMFTITIRSKEFDPRVLQICEYMKLNVQHIQSVRGLAKQFFISESYLRKLFQTNLAVTPLEYLKQMKTNMAAELLLNSSHTLAEIAEMIGYSSQRQFSRGFKYTTGMRPSEYRVRARSGMQ